MGNGAALLNERVYDDIVGAVYEAAVEPLRLKQALGRVVEAVSATGAHLVGVEKSSRHVVLSAITGFSPLGEIDYNERYAKVDPRAPIYLGARMGEWLSCHEYFDQAYVDRSEFFQDFLIPYGSRYCSAVKLIETESYAAILGVHRNVRQEPLAADALSFLERLTPHFQRAIRLIHEHAKLQNQWAVVKAALDMLDYGALVCDESGVVLVTNTSAASTLEEHRDGIGLRRDRLFVHDARVDAKLRAILLSEPLQEAGTAVRGALKGALLVPRRSGLPAYQLILCRIDPERTILGSGNSGLWSVMISDPARASVPTMRAISVLYGLTPAETRLATFLIAGAAPEEIAERTHVKLPTVRSQLSSLFAKTGTRRQAELVRLFSTVPALREDRSSDISQSSA